MSPSCLKPLTVVATAVLLAAGCADGDSADVAVSGDPVTTTVMTTTVVTTTAPAHDEVDADGDAADHDAVVAHDATTTTSQSADDGAAPSGSAGEIVDEVDVVIPVGMVEFGYELDPIEIPSGAVVRFDFVNDGAIEHEAMLGDHHQQEEFAGDGAHGSHGGGGDDGGHHGEVQALTLATGESGSLVVTLDEPGELLIGCHLPGHWDAGMVASVQVV